MRASERITRAREKLDRAEADLAGLRAYVERLEQVHIDHLNSTSWQATERLRRLLRRLRRQPPTRQFKPRLAGGGQSQAAGRARAKIATTLRAARSGFAPAAAATLAKLAADTRLPDDVRAQAERAKFLAEADSPDPAARPRLLAEIRRPAHWRGPGRPAIERAVLRVSLLQETDQPDEAARIVRTAMEEAGGHPDLLLLGSSALTDPAERLSLLSQAFDAAAGLGVARARDDAPFSVDNLAAPGNAVDGPLVSVIMPAYCSSETIATSLRSITAQTWRNLEILVADDASTDDTAAIVADLAREDPRIRLIARDRNGGAYAARNAALAEARGEFVTCQDADDWSHPARLARQVAHLSENPDLIANVSHWARATTDLQFMRRPFTARVIHFNSSSIMFRRAPVLERVGYWDAVRFAGDTEFWHRLQAAFGAAATAELPEMLAIGRERAGSLSRASASAHRGGKVGARRSYEQLYRDWHGMHGPDGLRLDRAPAARPFAVPEVLRTGRPLKATFDAVLVSDFRHVGGTSASNHQELLAQTRAGIRTAIVQVYRYGYDVDRGVHPAIRAMVEDGTVTELVYGDEVEAGVTILRFPPIFSEPQPWLPAIRTGNVRVVVNQPPRRVDGEAPFYAIDTCRTNIADWLGQPGAWVPIGPQVRDALAADGQADALSSEDWLNIIDIDAWALPRAGWQADRPVIGRHGRDSDEKWLSRADDLLAAYPEDGSMLVRVLGGARIPARIIGHTPGWEVLPFNSVSPRDFLATLDFFVFFPHQDRIEAFGRTIIEAMASGCLTILPAVFRPLFGEAAIYCAPAEVRDIVLRYFADREAYLAQTARAQAIVRDRFGFEQHVARMRRAMGQS